MKRFILSLSIWLSLCALAVAGNVLLLGAGSPGGGGGGGSYDASTVAWTSAVTSAGGSVSPTQEGRVDTLITCLKTNSIWSLLDRYWWFAGENTTQARIDLKALQTATVNGTCTFTAGHGYASDGSTCGIDSNFTPSSGTNNWTSTSAHMSAYLLVSAGGSGIAGGFQGNGDPYSVLDFQICCNSGEARLNGSNVVEPTITSSVGGQLTASLLSGNISAYYNGAKTTTPVTNPLVLPYGHILALARNGDTPTYAPDNFAAAGVQIASTSYGAGLNDTQANALQACENAIATAEGINTH